MWLNRPGPYNHLQNINVLIYIRDYRILDSLPHNAHGPRAIFKKISVHAIVRLCMKNWFRWSIKAPNIFKNNILNDPKSIFTVTKNKIKPIKITLEPIETLTATEPNLFFENHGHFLA